MIQDREHSADKCIPRINEFWRKLGVNASAQIDRKGEIKSRLTSGLPDVRLPSQSALNRATRASGALRSR